MTTSGPSRYPRFAPAIGLGVVGLGILIAGFVGASTAAAWACLAALAIAFAAWRVRRTGTRSDWIILGTLALMVLGFVAFLTWVYLANIQVGS